MAHLYNGILRNRKKGLLPFATVWMDLETIMPHEISQSVKEIPYELIYMWNLMKINKIETEA